MSALRQHNSSVVPATADMGTEHLLTEACATEPLACVLPVFMRSTWRSAMTRFMFGDPFSDREEEVSQGLYWAFQVCGVPRILFNACNDMLSALEHYENLFAPCFQVVCQFLSCKGSSGRLV